jgi:hypothetical protein
LPGNIAGKYCRKILPENIAGKYRRKISPENIAGKYRREILPGKNRLNCGRENPPDPGKNFSLSLWAGEQICAIICLQLGLSRIKPE